jgi:hypothetical protein
VKIENNQTKMIVRAKKTIKMVKKEKRNEKRKKNEKISNDRIVIEKQNIKMC